MYWESNLNVSYNFWFYFYFENQKQLTHVAVLHGSDVRPEATVWGGQGGLHAGLQLIERHCKVGEVVHLEKEEKESGMLGVCVCKCSLETLLSIYAQQLSALFCQKIRWLKRLMNCLFLVCLWVHHSFLYERLTSTKQNKRLTKETFISWHWVTCTGFVCVFYTVAECAGLESILHSKVLPGTTETVSWTSGMSSASSFSAPSSSSWKEYYSL